MRLILLGILLYSFNGVAMDPRGRMLASFNKKAEPSPEECIGINDGDRSRESPIKDAEGSCCGHCKTETFICGIGCVLSCVVAFLGCQDCCERRRKYAPVK
jgi:hypothetical protein